jgi:hypothetical protein
MELPDNPSRAELSKQNVISFPVLQATFDIDGQVGELLQTLSMS